MHVALYHDAVIPPPDYGGTERVIVWLARGLLSLGHQVTLIARPGPGSLPGVELIPIVSGEDWEKKLPASVDIAHLWAPPAREPSKPCVVTIGGVGKPGETFHPNTIFVSRSHAENHECLNYVHNGIDPDDFVSSSKRGDYAVFLAKASWSVKNVRGAIAVAKAAGMPIEILGSRELPFGLKRLQSALASIQGSSVSFRGMVGDAEKREALSRARALIFPVRWPEPFGLAVTESLASGCAVLATPYGSLPEIVTPDVGVLSTKGDELAAALRKSATFSPDRCRARVLAGFTHLDMARSYVAHYERVLSRGSLELKDGKAPRTRAGLDVTRLYDWSDPVS